MCRSIKSISKNSLQCRTNVCLLNIITNPKHIFAFRKHCNKMTDLARGLIQTVLGPIEPAQLGSTLCHEHLYHHIDYKVMGPKAQAGPYLHLNSTPVTTDNLWYTNYHPYSHQDNLDFTSSSIQDILQEELKFFKLNGGQSLVEVSTFGDDSRELVKLSKASGVNIISSTGFYVAPTFSDDIISQSVESLYETMKNEFTVGVNGIKAGVVGELGSNWPIHQFEKNVLKAAAHLQNELGVPVIIHPGRNKEAPFEIMRIFTEAGGKVAKTVMSHLDRTLFDEDLIEFAQIGAICELDLFGTEISYYELSDTLDMPNDLARIRQVKNLIDEGFADRITISHDIHTKNRLMPFGGHGFSHILLNVLPQMKKRGITSEHINQIMVNTPRQWLTL